MVHISGALHPRVSEDFLGEIYFCFGDKQLELFPV